MANNSLEVFRTSIKLGSIEIDAYTAHQKDEHGRWINYLSGAGMATSIKLHRNTTLQNRMSEELKALLGKDFTTLQGKYRNSQNSFSKVELWTTSQAPKYWRYHDRKGNQIAGLIIDALTGVSLDAIINDRFKRTYSLGSTEQWVNQIINKTPDTDRPVHFNKDWQKEATRVTGHHWQGLAMANFIHRAVYKMFGSAVQKRLNEVNPYGDSGVRRDALHYQFFVTNADEKLVRAQIQTTYTLLKISACESDFWRHMSNHFGNAIQLEIDL
jgi:hypothetical protein